MSRPSSSVMNVPNLAAPTTLSGSSAVRASTVSAMGGTTVTKSQQSSGIYSAGVSAATPTYATAGSMNFIQSSAGASGSQTVSAGQQTVTSERIMSSTVIGEHQLNATPEDSIQYVEVPVYEEVVRHVPKKEVVEIEKRVPRYEYEWVERIVEVPQIQIVDKLVEVPQIQEIIKHVPIKQVVDVPREVVRYVPKIETKIVEQEVEVVGETIEVPKPYLVENKIVVPRYVDREVATVVAQRLHPIITESDTDFVDVELKEYNPQLIPVDVYIPRPVARNLIAAAKYEEHRVVDVPPAQYNALVKNLNTHIGDKDSDAIYVKMADGSIPMLHGLGASIVPPMSNEWEKYHQKGQSHIIWTSGLIMPGTTTSGSTTTMVGGVQTAQLAAASRAVAQGGGHYSAGQYSGQYMMAGSKVTSGAAVGGRYVSGGYTSTGPMITNAIGGQRMTQYSQQTSIIPGTTTSKTSTTTVTAAA